MNQAQQIDEHFCVSVDVCARLYAKAASRRKPSCLMSAFGQRRIRSPRSMFALAIMSLMEQFNEAVTFAQSHEIP